MSITGLMVRETMRRTLHEPTREPQPRRPRRAVALILHTAAQRLDPGVTASRRVTVGR